MNQLNRLPAGLRLDVWTDFSTREPPVDAPEIALLREELRKAVPQFAGMLELLNNLRPVQDLAARAVGPAQAQVITQRIQ